ncbi:sensor histidine kinase [Nitrospirillum bahiense]|uniref:histidine kinase n=1 Tax=Nitrospirillum amazonense TaxID=28077 RepID=A0A560FTJ7_9PROT|nr:ATP-binding protein [Nitrospirillum amazonense]TWB24927.1 signal transduction histidine kinase [Nitrospirillum amazonense]
MRRTELFRAGPFRLALGFATALSVGMLLIFGFIYWQTSEVETRRMQRDLVQEAAVAAQTRDDILLYQLQVRIMSDYHRVTVAAWFDADGKRRYGNLDALPPGLPIDDKGHRLDIQTNDARQPQPAILAAAKRSDGGIVVLGRAMDELLALQRVVARTLIAGLLPAVALVLASGVLGGARARRRVQTVQQTIGRIMGGDLRERLPLSGNRDAVDQLSARVNQMLDRIVHLLDEIRAVGDNIAHDLRTPLSVMRAKLERGLAAEEPEELRRGAEAALADLDKAFGMITALLRIAELEDSRRQAGFTTVDLAEVAGEVFDLYEPLAEAKGVTLAQEAGGPLFVTGDRDLLIEAVANLVDNAVKFTPEGGRVLIRTRMGGTGGEAVPVVEVSDTGPGIPAAERAAVVRRLYRLDKSRHIQGNGLGLSLVQAIAALHGFKLVIDGNDLGAVIALICGAADGEGVGNPGVWP